MERSVIYDRHRFHPDDCNQLHENIYPDRKHLSIFCKGDHFQEDIDNPQIQRHP